MSETVSSRLRARAAKLKAHIDYVKAEHAESDRTGESSWMDCISKDDVAHDEQHCADLLVAAEALDVPQRQAGEP